MSASWKQNTLVALLFWLLAALAVSAMIVDDVSSDEVHSDDVDVDADVDVLAVTDEGTTTTMPTPAALLPGPRILRKVGWKCPLVTPVSNVTLETIMGRWYLLEVISSSRDNRKDACAGVDFWRWDDNVSSLTPDVFQPPDVGPEHLVMRGFNRRGSERASGFRIDTTIVVQGSGNAIWDQPGFGPAMGMTVAVLDYTRDRHILTLETCVHGYNFGWTSVLGRDPNTTHLQLNEVHERLRLAGVVNVGRAVVQDNAGCVYR